MPKENGGHFEGIFKCISLKKKSGILTEISLH